MGDSVTDDPQTRRNAGEDNPPELHSSPPEMPPNPPAVTPGTASTDSGNSAGGLDTSSIPAAGPTVNTGTPSGTPSSTAIVRNYNVRFYVHWQDLQVEEYPQYGLAPQPSMVQLQPTLDDKSVNSIVSAVLASLNDFAEACEADLPPGTPELLLNQTRIRLPSPTW
jgi:hypothetical protein